MLAIELFSATILDMSAFIDGANNQIPQDMLQDGLDWALEESVAEKEEHAEQVLKDFYIHGMMLFGRHVELLQERIEESGGIKQISERDALGRGKNHIHLCDGSYLTGSELFVPEPIVTELPDSLIAGDVVGQKHILQVSFGGNGIGIDGVTAPDSESIALADGTLKKVLKGKYIPSSVCVMEGITTTRHAPSIDREVSVVSGTVAQLVGRMWGSKLRPEFAPDPIREPDAYARWVHEEPMPQLAVAFGASDLLRHKHWPYDREISFGIHPALESIISLNDEVTLDVAKAQKLIRFENLLSRYYHHFMGEAMPVRAESAGLVQPQPSLAAPSAS